MDSVQKYSLALREIEAEEHLEAMRPLIRFDAGDIVCDINHRGETIFLEIIEWSGGYVDGEHYSVEYKAMTEAKTMRKITDESQILDAEDERIKRRPPKLFPARDALNKSSDFYTYKSKFKGWR